MNSYNDNLRTGVITALQNQELELKTVQAQYNAAMFTLYYAEGAAITAAEKVLAAEKDLNDFKAPVKNQAVDNSNITNNLVLSAGQAGKYVKQAVTNTAVSASNVQIAANAIIKLASDVGAIYSIVNAADFGTNIFELTKKAYAVINDTAYNAELTSQASMEASMLTSEVSVSTVVDKAKVVKTGMDNILKITSTDFDNASEMVRSANVNLSTVSAKEKLAEGAFGDVSVEYAATGKALAATNTQLNLDLTVSFPNPNVQNQGFTVTFNLVRLPFAVNLITNIPHPATPPYPMQNYFIMVVKEAKKSIFSLSVAENIRMLMGNNFVEVDTHESIHDYTASQAISIGESLTDTDGDKLVAGTSYVVFIYGEYQEAYKKDVNDFDEFLSAPSAPFTMTTVLTPVNSADIQVKWLTEGTEAPANPTVDKTATEVLTFSVAAEENLSIQYRCMFLPEEKMLTAGLIKKALISARGEKEVERQTQAMKNIVTSYDPQIALLESEINNLHNQAAAAEALPEAEASTAAKAPDAPNVADLVTQLNKVKAQKEAALATLDVVTQDKLGFLFNVTLAENVLAGNYTAVDGNSKQASYQVDIDPATTDNFGNLLVDGISYIPVILSVYNGSAEVNDDQYTSTISDYEKTKAFVYHAQKRKESDQ